MRVCMCTFMCVSVNKLEYDFTTEQKFCLISVLQKPSISISFPSAAVMCLSMEKRFSEQWVHTFPRTCTHSHLGARWSAVGQRASPLEPTEVKAPVIFPSTFQAMLVVFPFSPFLLSMKSHWRMFSRLRWLSWISEARMDVAFKLHNRRHHSLCKMWRMSDEELLPLVGYWFSY